MTPDCFSRNKPLLKLTIFQIDCLKSQICSMKNNIAKLAFAGLVLLTVFSACEKEYPTIQQEDDKEINKYIQTNSLSGMKEYVNPDGSKAGFFYQIIEQGTGSVVGNTDLVYITYTAKSFDGLSNFDDESKFRFTDYLGYFGKIKQKLPDAFRTSVRDILKQKGGKIRLLVPSNQAYGMNGSDGNSPPFFKVAGNQSLDCSITLYNVDSQASFDDALIKNYIKKNNLTALTRTSSGLYYQIISAGAGSVEVLPSSMVSVAYTGKLTNGTVFDQATTTTPLKTTLSTLIPGWVEGLPKIKKGGSIRLIIPSALGYGSRDEQGLPPANSILDFNIELIDVTN